MTVAASRAFHWLTERTGYTPGGDARSVVALGPDGRIRGMVVVDRWTESAAHMHVALDAPGACRGLLKAAFSYVFGECGLGLVRGEVRSTNARSLALARHLGFREVYCVRDGWAAGEDIIGLEMRRTECRWLKEENHG